MPSYIPDGYTLRHTIPPIEGEHEGLSYEYRPLVGLEQDGFYSSMREAPEGEQDRLREEYVVDRICDWDLTDPRPESGGPVDVSAEVLARLDSRIYDAVMRRVLCLGQAEKETQKKKKKN